MNITLSPEQMQLIEVQLAQGLFSSPSEVITKALQTLAQTQKHYWEWEEQVRESVELFGGGTIAGLGRANASKFYVSRIWYIRG